MLEYEEVNGLPEELRNKAGIIIERPTGPAQYRLWGHVIDDTLEWLCGKGDHSNPNGHATWRNNIRLARGQHWAEQVADSDELNRGADLIEDHVTVSHISLHIENLVAYLSRNNPYFPVKPRRGSDTDSAKAQEAVLNYFWREIKGTPELRKCLRDYCTIGHMVGRTDWWKASDLLMARPEKTDNPEATTNYDSFKKPEHPGFRRVNPFTFLIDRSSPSFDLKGARWCGELMARPKADVIADERYDASVRRAIRLGSEQPRTLSQHLSMYEAGEGYGLTETPEDCADDQTMLLAEIWDKRFRMRYIFALGVEKPLVEQPWPYGYLDDFPYEFANFIPVPNEIYGISHPHLAGQAQLLLDRLRTKMALHARKHNAKYQVPEGALASEELQKWVNDQDGELIQTKQGHKIDAIQQASTGFDFKQAMDIVQGDMYALMNTDALARGGPLPSRTSAQEIETRTQLHGMKLSDHAATVDAFVQSIGEQLLKHTKANLQTDMAIRIAGRVGSEYIEVTPEDIKADIDVEVESSSREVVTPAVEREQLMTLLQTLTTMLPQIIQLQEMGGVTEPINVNFNELIKQVVSKFDGVEQERIFPAVADPPTPIPEGYAEPQIQNPPNPPAPQPPPTGVNLAQSARQQSVPSPIAPGSN